MDLATAPRGELVRLIYQLRDENEALKAEIAELRSHLHEPPKTSGPLPSFVKPNTKRKKLFERKRREHGYGRTLDVPTKRVFHACETCPECGGPLGKPSVAYTRQVVDIPLPQAEITEHVVFKRLCLNCGKRVYPKPDLGLSVVGKQRLGVNLMSLVGTLREELLTPLGKLRKLLSVVYHLDLSEGVLVNILDKVAAHGHPEYERIKNKIRSSEVVWADETGSRQAGQNAYSWNFSTNKLQLLLYHRRRNKDVVGEVLGTETEEGAFTGVLVSDFLGSYNEYQGFHQRCWVHLLRDIHELQEQYHGRHPPLNRWAKKIRELVSEAKSFPGPSPSVPVGLAQREREEKEEYFKNKAGVLCKRYLIQKAPMSTLCGRIITFLPELFTFVRFPGVSSDNNKAERDLRHLVVARKISGGTRSPKGSKTKEILDSLFGTWRLQNLNPLEQCRLLLVSTPCQEV